MSSSLRIGAAAVALALLMVAPGRGAAQRFYPDDPLWTDEDRAFDATGAKEAEVSEAYDFVMKSFGKVGDRRDIRALNVNTLDEVPDSSWFTNRIGRRPMPLDEIRTGPDTFKQFDVTDWVIIQDKGAPGFQPGFRAYDARDTRERKQWYQLEGDTEDYPELASGVEMIGTLFYHAFGYNVVDTYVVNVDPKRITIAPDATFEDPNGDRRFRKDDLDEILKMLARNKDGTYRMTASRFVEGTPLESFEYVGTRPDDPNDIYAHEHRRELRANRVFAAWLNHDDSRGVNSLDMLVPGDGRKWIRHYMFDFGSLLGSSPRPWSGEGYMYEGTAHLEGAGDVRFLDAAVGAHSLSAICRSPWAVWRRTRSIPSPGNPSTRIPRSTTCGRTMRSGRRGLWRRFRTRRSRPSWRGRSTRIRAPRPTSRRR